MLELPNYKLNQDVPTRWNSSHDMVERYLEQKVAVYSTLTDQAVRKNVKDIVTLSENDIRLAEEVIKVCKPPKTVTTLICTENIPSVSMVLPMKTMILKSMVASDEDEPAVRDVKTAIRVNLEPRYADPGVQDFLHKSTTLDPRFKSLLYMDAAARLRVNELTAEIETNIQQGQALSRDGRRQGFYSRKGGDLIQGSGLYSPGC
nr:zinc finger BED domain-containing protein 4-like [Salvelinus alpinus]